MRVPFYKYHGAANDFILIDNRSGDYALTAAQVRRLCHRRLGIGSDGLISLEAAPEAAPGPSPYGFAMRFYNPDASQGPMCGNGGRCIAAFAAKLGIENLNFIGADGPHAAHILHHNGPQWVVALQMQDVPAVQTIPEKPLPLVHVFTGCDHAVRFVPEVATVNMAVEGPALRWDARFGPQGINANFATLVAPGQLQLRTFERGVEDETWACGTGAVAAALAAYTVHRSTDGPAPLHWEVATKGGLLEVDFSPCAGVPEGGFSRVVLTGGAEEVFAGEVEI